MSPPCPAPQSLCLGTVSCNPTEFCYFDEAFFPHFNGTFRAGNGPFAYRLTANVTHRQGPGGWFVRYVGAAAFGFSPMLLCQACCWSPTIRLRYRCPQCPGNPFGYRRDRACHVGAVSESRAVNSPIKRQF